MEIILNPNPETIPATTTSAFLRALLGRCQRALFEPARFFRHDLPQMSLSDALAFGIGNAWAAATVAFFVQTFNTLLVGQLLERWMQRLVASEEGFELWGLSANSFLYSSGALLLGPFLFLLRACFVSVWLYLFARLLIEDRPGAPEPVTFKGALRVQAAVLTAQWFSVVPVFGGFLAFVVSLILTVTGVRERFGVSTRRALAVVLAPYFLFFVLLILLAAMLIFGLTQVPWEEMLQMDGRESFSW
jgi:hypothetical protein